MIAVILLILRTIGIVLLWILAIAVILLLLVLLVPVPYKASGFYNETYQIKAIVSWLLHLVHFRVDFDKAGLTYKLRIAGIPLLTEKGRSRKQSRKHKQHRHTTETDSREESAAEDSQPEFMESDEEPDSGWQEYFETAENPEGTGTAEIPDKKKRNVTGGLKDFFRRVSAFLKSFPDRMRRFRKSLEHAGAKIRHLWNEKEKWEAFFASETFHRAFESAKKYGLILLKRIRPRKIEVTVHYGFEDPSATGKAFGVFSVIRTYLPGTYNVTPDFNEKCLEGDFLLSGRIILIQMIPPLWHLYRDKNIRRCYHKLRK